jgi:Ca2+-binding RTX toxin-like protein
MRRLRLLTFVAGLALLVGTALTATSTIATSRVDDVKQAVTVNKVRPPECAGLSLSRVLTGAGTINDANNSTPSLVLGSVAADAVNGRGGNDCIVGGAGSDTINGGAGTDVCIGGAGTDAFTACETSYP